MPYVLITGGAGFIGSHLAYALIARGDRVRVLDSLDPKVHRVGQPTSLHRDVDLHVGDVRDPSAVNAALAGVEAVIHLAAAVGLGQSAQAVENYTSVNAMGTAVLLEALTHRRVSRLIVASSMSVYGEGLYMTEEGKIAHPCRRSTESLRQGNWEPVDAEGNPLTPLPTPESKSPMLESLYALGKYDQERLSLLVGRACGISTVALRLFNVYGPGQALANPYSGVLTIFGTRLINGRPPLVFEDGLQQRDFVNVRDVVRAILLSLDRDEVSDTVLNIGSGTPHTVREVARCMADVLGSNVEPKMSGQYQAGDIRHCFGDIGRARALLGYEARVSLGSGMLELTTWLAEQQAQEQGDTYDDARAGRLGITR
jgi:dTDP-L-rhamnose 4-epimerase